jgi:flagellar assembly protein FliH
MDIKPLDFRDFDSGVAIVRAGAQPFLPGGRRRSEAPPPPPPIFNETHVKAAEAQSYKKGFLDGIEEGKKQQDNEQASNDRTLMASLERMLNNLAPVFADYRNTIVRAQQDLPKAALAIARKVAEGALAENAAAAVEAAAMRCVEIMLGEPKLQITVHDTLVEQVKKKVADAATRQPLAKDVMVIGQNNLAVTDCRIEWKDGALTRDTGKIWEEIARVVEGMSSSATHDAQTKMDTLQAQVPTTTETTNAKKE